MMVQEDGLDFIGYGCLKFLQRLVSLLAFS
jgi:hypothetical protein